MLIMIAVAAAVMEVAMTTNTSNVTNVWPAFQIPFFFLNILIVLLIFLNIKLSGSNYSLHGFCFRTLCTCDGACYSVGEFNCVSACGIAKSFKGNIGNS